MVKPPCPACNSRLQEERGYYLCPTHGVIPYDWVRGTITQDKALAMMEKWGLVIERKAKKASRVVNDTPAPKGTVADLLAQLKSTMSPADKRKIRAALRKAGHVGGARS